MPILANPRHEKFAQLLAQGQSAHQSYIDAGFKPSRANASRLKANEGIGARVLELQMAGAKSAEITVASLLDELEHARQRADSLGQLSASVRAISEKARLAGLMVERQQIEVSNNNPDLYDGHSAETVAVRLAHEMLDGLTNARWLPISDADRQQLAAIVGHWLAEMQAFVDEVNSRPLISTRRIEPPLLTNGKPQS